MNTDIAAMAARLFAVDPVGLGGVLLQSAADETRSAWLRMARDLMPADSAWCRVPSHIDNERLLGGLDLAATLATGHTAMRRGVLAEANGGVVVLCMAERVLPGTAALIAAVQDAGAVAACSDGRQPEDPARWGLVALDEGEGEGERVARVLVERLALHVRLVPAPSRASAGPETMASSTRQEIAKARAHLDSVAADDPIVTALCEAAQALGVDSLRASCLALRVARAAAALRGSDVVEAQDAAWGACFVLGPRARAWPAGQDGAPPADENTPASAEPAEGEAQGTAETSSEPQTEESSVTPDEGVPPPNAGVRAMEESFVEAAGATLPPALLAAIAASRASGGMPHSGAQVARSTRSAATSTHGRPLGSRRGELRAGARLDLLQTLMAAAPWQPLRRRERAANGQAEEFVRTSILVRRSDFQVRGFRPREERVTIFAVDASGSQALHRLAEAKGAAELLLAECYVRRNRVAVLAFRGEGAVVLLPPTRSLVRAKRCLAGLPGGGATPLAAGLDAARQLAEGIARQGGTPTLVLLTDGKANVTRNGRPGRSAAHLEAVASARAWRETGIGALLLDTAPEPQAVAQQLAAAMQARYVALPHADSQALAHAILDHGRA